MIRFQPLAVLCLLLGMLVIAAACGRSESDEVAEPSASAGGVAEKGALQVSAMALTGTPVAADPLVRMPGTQPGNNVSLESPNRCLNCHGGYNTAVEPGHNWRGSMMAQASRDFVFWSCLTVAAQDAKWATGSPNAVDMCERCHFPKGWLEGRSDPPDVSAMTGADYDGVQCDFCHRTFDPFFAATHAGTREGADWSGYWDEANKSGTPSSAGAATTLAADQAQTPGITYFNGGAWFGQDHAPPATWTEATSGQFFVSSSAEKRSSFADAAARHQMLYSRFGKSRYMCGTCHDVSNAVLANLAQKDAKPGDGTTKLATEVSPAHAYMHVERTFSEFMLSDYAQGGGAPGIGPFAPDKFKTSLPGNVIGRCQDCHMRDVVGAGCNKAGVPVRPDGSAEHPKSGQPLHDLTGGNHWVPWILASTVDGSPNYDATNAQLLKQGPAVLTLDLTQGLGLDAPALLDGAKRALEQLALAASIQNLTYDAATGKLSFRVQNHTGHKLISGFPEGRRMFINVKVLKGGAVIHEINPYDDTVGTLKGLPATASKGSPALAANEAHVDALVYEMHPTSTLTGEQETFHFALATGRYKDNRIPPKGFRIDQAKARLAQPVWHGADAPELYTAAEYQGGYDDVSLTVPTGGDDVAVRLYYQTTSREYIEFLRDEIKGTAGALTLPATAYVAQTDPFFAKLKPWGDVIWQLWQHNKDVPGAAPVLMAEASLGGGACDAPTPELVQAVSDKSQVTLTWSDVHSAAAQVTGYAVYLDQAGKSQHLADVGKVSTWIHADPTQGQTYCYKVMSVTAKCESPASNVVCATAGSGGTGQVGAGPVNTGRLETSGKGKGSTTVVVLATTFQIGDTVVVQTTVNNQQTGGAVADATVEFTISGPESVVLVSGPSAASGLAQVQWKTSGPNKKGMGGTAPGTYQVKVTGLTAAGFSWDAVQQSATFTVQ